MKAARFMPGNACEDRATHGRRVACYVPSWNPEVLCAEGKCAAITKPKDLFKLMPLFICTSSVFCVEVDSCLSETKRVGRAQAHLTTA